MFLTQHDAVHPTLKITTETVPQPASTAVCISGDKTDNNFGQAADIQG